MAGNAGSQHPAAGLVRTHFTGEPQPYVRMVERMQWAATPTSPLGRYLAYKDDIRRQWEMSYSDVPPFEGPLVVGGSFTVTKNWARKDLDNLIKGIHDALNPYFSHTKAVLQLGPWIDDRLIKVMSGYSVRPGDEPGIDLTIQPIFTTADPFGAFGIGTATGYVVGDLFRIDVIDGHPFYMKASPLFAADEHAPWEVAVIFDTIGNNTKLFLTPLHALVWLVAGRVRGARPDIERIFVTSDDVNLENIIPTRYEKILDEAWRLITGVTRQHYETLLHKLVLFHGAAWPDVRGHIRERMLHLPIKDPDMAAWTAGMPTRTLKKKVKKPGRPGKK